MIGVMGLEHYGLLDINLVYVNPTFLWSAIIGGLIMGLGFRRRRLLSGNERLCRRDREDRCDDLHRRCRARGVRVRRRIPCVRRSSTRPPTGGVRACSKPSACRSISSPSSLAIVALGAFVLVSIVENRVNGIDTKPIRMTRYYVGLASIGLLVALSAFMFPGTQSGTPGDGRRMRTSWSGRIRWTPWRSTNWPSGSSTRILRCR